MLDAFERAGLTVLERGWLSSNNILFRGDGHGRPAVLVDTGYASHAAQTVALVRDLLGDRPLQRIVNTHLHSDHCGGNHALQAAYGCAVDVPIAEADAVDRWDEAVLGYRATGQQCPRFQRTGVIAPGQTLELGRGLWQVIGSPGHDPASVVLHEPEQGILVSADALWENGFGIVFEALDDPAGFGAVRDTLERLAALPARWVIPGHGAPFGDPGRAIERALRRLDGLVAAPDRHARHAAKVLVKFHFLDVRRETRAAFDAWIKGVDCLRAVHRRYGGAAAYAAWCEGLVDELEAGGALKRSDGWVANA
jgi:glyoxylase-like metal-dependent hydrolase (beta-lactamase superfamily II)